MIKVAIIGTGGISKAHFEAYQQFPERCQITALSDIYPEKAEEKAKNFNIEAVIYDNFEDVANHPDIDLVSICTPPYTHAMITIAMLKAGKHVLVEKPMASSLEESDAMMDAAKQSGRMLSVIAQNRFKTPVMKLKQVLESGLIGPTVHIQVDSHWWRGHCYYDLWWRGTWEKEGGGCTINHAVHHIDMLQWMNGMPKEVTAIMSNTSHDNAEVEDLSVTVLKYDNGTLGQITSSVVHHGEEQQLIFQGKNARVSVPWRVTASTSSGNGFPEPNPVLEQQLQEMYEQLPEVLYDGHFGQIDDVLSAVETGSPLLIDGKSGRDTLELITAIYKSASLAKTVFLPIDNNDPFYSREGIMEHALHFYEKTGNVENFAENNISTNGNYGK